MDNIPMNQNSNPAKLSYLGRATVRIETSGGKTIYIDPYAKGDYSKPADIVLITHYHGDHNDLSKITQAAGCRVITPNEALINGGYQSFEIEGIRVKAVPAYNKNHRREETVGYIVDIGGIKLYHAGDTSKIPEMADLSDEKLQYALLPVDGFYNMGPKEASECADLINSQNYIPIHSDRSKDFNQDNVEQFNAQRKIVMKPGDMINL